VRTALHRNPVRGVEKVAAFGISAKARIAERVHGALHFRWHCDACRDDPKGGLDQSFRNAVEVEPAARSGSGGPPSRAVPRSGPAAVAVPGPGCRTP
jgi:hypothetical protein